MNSNRDVSRRHTLAVYVKRFTENVGGSDIDVSSLDTRVSYVRTTSICVNRDKVFSSGSKLIVAYVDDSEFDVRVPLEIDLYD